MMSIREKYEIQMAALLDEVIQLGKMVDQAVRLSVQAFKQADKVAAAKVIAGDILINQKRYELETMCISLIATQQPMARDVRFLTAVLEIITELERIGDYAKGIGKICTQMPQGTENLPTIPLLLEMAEKGLSMLEMSLKAFIAFDTGTARKIPDLDYEVDNAYNTITEQLTAGVIRNPELVRSSNYVLWAAHNLERLADRSINICERIVYVTTGEMIEMDEIQ